jgi:hypothetical protein
MSSQIDLMAIISPKPGKADRVRSQRLYPSFSLTHVFLGGRAPPGGVEIRQRQRAGHPEVRNQSRGQQEVRSGAGHND